VFSPYYKQVSLTPITTTITTTTTTTTTTTKTYFNLHMFWQQTKRHNTEHWFINTTNKEIQVFRDMLSVSSRTTHALKMEATDSCTTLVTFTYQHSATFQMI
jgi:PhoPQ-activated pathogenicity-related protein